MGVIQLIVAVAFRQKFDSISISNLLLKTEATCSIARIIKYGCNLIASKRLASTKILPCISRSRTEQIYSQTTLQLRIPSLVKYRN